MGSWDKIKTKHGYNADEVISALQKSIRRGVEKDTVFFAYEMMSTSTELAEKFWQRIRVISVEDIGLANPQLIGTVFTLHQNYILLDGKEDRFLQGLIAALLLCRSPKSRFIDELYNNLKDKIEKEQYKIEIPDYALDKHTARGEAKGRGSLHFWGESSLLKNDVSENEKDQLEEILKRLNK